MKSMNAQVNYDVLVIGSGAAGLTLALHLSAKYRVALLSKQRLQDGSTWFAQGASPQCWTRWIRWSHILQTH